MAGCGLTEIYERGELCGEQHLSRTLFPLVCKDTYQQKHMAYLSLYLCQLDPLCIIVRKAANLSILEILDFLHCVCV